MQSLHCQLPVIPTINLVEIGETHLQKKYIYLSKNLFYKEREIK
jgi:hypothetical protein